MFSLNVSCVLRYIYTVSETHGTIIIALISLVGCIQTFLVLSVPRDSFRSLMDSPIMIVVTLRNSQAECWGLH
jgi:hypothetical protein